MALTLFFLGLPYGNEPIKVDYTVEIKTVIHTEENESNLKYAVCSVSVKCENIGRPYKGSSGDEANISFYRIVDGEKQYLNGYSYHENILPQDIIIKHGEVRELDNTYYFDDGTYDPGEYTVEVRVKHSDKVYTDTITLT